MLLRCAGPAQPTARFKGPGIAPHHCSGPQPQTGAQLCTGYLTSRPLLPCWPLKQGYIVLVTSLLSGDTVGNLKEMISGTQAWSEQEKNSTDNVFED